MPAASARSIRSNACVSFSPMPKNAGAEPMPPKLPQPSPSREIRRPVDPSRRYSIARKSLLDVAWRAHRGPAMRSLAIIVVSLSTAAALHAAPTPREGPQSARGESPRVLIENARVRVYRTTAGALTSVDHMPAVIVSLDDDPTGIKRGTAVWVNDAAAPPSTANLRGAIVIVQPHGGAAAPPPAAASKPGDAPFTGMSFTPIFDNDRVSAIRARMEVGAREGFHTHASDTIVVHLS